MPVFGPASSGESDQLSPLIVLRSDIQRRYGPCIPSHEGHANRIHFTLSLCRPSATPTPLRATPSSIRQISDRPGLRVVEFPVLQQLLAPARKKPASNADWVSTSVANELHDKGNILRLSAHKRLRRRNLPMFLMGQDYLVVSEGSGLKAVHFASPAPEFQFINFVEEKAPSPSDR